MGCEELIYSCASALVLGILVIIILVIATQKKEGLMLLGWPQNTINEWGQYLNHLAYPRDDLYPDQGTLDGILQNKAPYAIATPESADTAKRLLESVYDRDESNIDDMCTWRKSYGDYQTKMAATYRSSYTKDILAPWLKRELYENEQRRWYDNDELDYQFTDPQQQWAQKSWPGGIDEQSLFMP